MLYVIMNRNSIEGYQKGFMETLPPCFFERPYFNDNEEEMYKWTPCMGEARRFSTEAEAWRFAQDTWGTKFAMTNFVVVSAHYDVLEASLIDRNRIKDALDERAVRYNGLYRYIRELEAQINELKEVSY